MGIEAIKAAQRAARLLTKRLGSRIQGVALFGSFARGEEDERSDLDLLVITDKIPRGTKRRALLYETIYPIVASLRRDATIVDLEASDLISSNTDLTPQLLNIAWDAVIVHDPRGILSNLVHQTRKLVKTMNLQRYRTPDGKYGWKRADGAPLIHLET